MIALGMSSAVRMVMLRSRIYRYYQLQFTGVSDACSIARDKYHIDEICRDARRYVHLFIWPSLVLSSFLMALFLLDMAYDDEEAPSLAGPFSIFAITILGAQCIRIVFLRSKAGLDRVLEQNLQSSVEERTKQDDVFVSVEAGGSSTGAAVNPLQGTILELRPSALRTESMYDDK